jgi:hypothetical protein
LEEGRVGGDRHRRMLSWRMLGDRGRKGRGFFERGREGWRGRRRGREETGRDRGPKPTFIS